jgi:hypothetical protein
MRLSSKTGMCAQADRLDQNLRNILNEELKCEQD